jgi:transketolase
MDSNETPQPNAAEIIRLSTEVTELRARLQAFMDAMPQSYVPRVEDQARREGQDKLLEAMNAKLDKLIEKSEDLAPIVATHGTHIEILEGELLRLRTWMMGCVASALIAVFAVILQLVFTHR